LSLVPTQKARKDKPNIPTGSQPSQGAGGAQPDEEGARSGSVEPVRAHYVIVSPLTSKDLPSDLAPCWAVPRCGRAIGEEYNMMLEEFDLELSWPANLTKNIISGDGQGASEARCLRAGDA